MSVTIRRGRVEKYSVLGGEFVGFIGGAPERK